MRMQPSSEIPDDAWEKARRYLHLIRDMQEKQLPVRDMARELRMRHQVLGRIITIWRENGTLPKPKRRVPDDPRKRVLGPEERTAQTLPPELKATIEANKHLPWVIVTRNARIPAEHWDAAWSHHHAIQQRAKIDTGNSVPAHHLERGRPARRP